MNLILTGMRYALVNVKTLGVVSGVELVHTCKKLCKKLQEAV